MLNTEELRVDVTEAAGLGSPAETAASLYHPAGTPDAVCIAFPGGGYGRRYWDFAIGDDDHGQAGWHAARGWAFAAIDTLGVGDATIPDGDPSSLEVIAAVNAATVDTVLARLGRPAVPVIGIGQSMGGAFVVVTQAHHRCFDAIASLGSSAVHTVVPAGPGRAMPLPWFARGSTLDDPVVLGPPSSDAGDFPEMGGPEWRWAFHHDDENPALIDADLAGMAGGALPPWRSAAVPECAATLLTPGVVAAEAAAIDVPVFVGVGERDVVPDPRREPEAYRSSPDITVVVTPRMAHMHNFATTRHRLWARLHAWGGSISRR